MKTSSKWLIAGLVLALVGSGLSQRVPDEVWSASGAQGAQLFIMLGAAALGYGFGRRHELE